MLRPVSLRVRHSAVFSHAASDTQRLRALMSDGAVLPEPGHVVEEDVEVRPAGRTCLTWESGCPESASRRSRRPPPGCALMAQTSGPARAPLPGPSCERARWTWRPPGRRRRAALRAPRLLLCALARNWLSGEAGGSTHLPGRGPLKVRVSDGDFGKVWVGLRSVRPSNGVGSWARLAHSFPNT